MRKPIVWSLVAVLLIQSWAVCDISFIAMGDLHYDRLEFHDLDWLKNEWRNPDDYRQVTEEYVVFTEKYWDKLVKVLCYQTLNYDPPVAAVVQLGDLLEGIAGNEELAEKMNRETVNALKNAELPVPWVLVKGNHDGNEGYGPGEAEAYRRHVFSFVNEQLNVNITDGFYTYPVGPVEFICVPDWHDRDYVVGYIEKALSKSTAQHKFVAMHYPVIPVTGRCWDIFNFRTANEHNIKQRNRLLNVLARHKAVVLCGHLHRYSVVRRITPEGPVVQVMLNSVIRDGDRNEPYWKTTEYGPLLVDLEPRFSPETQTQRRQSLVNEKPYVTSFVLADMPGYAIFTASTQEDDLTMEVFSGLNKTPVFRVKLSDLFESGCDKVGFDERGKSNINR